MGAILNVDKWAGPAQNQKKRARNRLQHGGDHMNIQDLQSQSTWRLVFLTCITYAVYPVHYILVYSVGARKR